MEQAKPPERLARSLWLLSWPVVVLNLLQVVNSLLDRFFIGHLPTAALTAHGASMSVIFTFFSVALSVSIGAGAIISRAYGAREFDEVRRASDQSLRVAVVIGICLGLIAALLAPIASSILLPSNSIEAKRLMTQFLLAYACGIPAMCINQTIASSLRSIGNSVAPMWFAGVQVPIHIGLNYLLVYRLSFGLVGAGVSLSVSVFISMFCFLQYARHGVLQARLSWHFPSREWLERILRISIPSAVQAILRTMSLMVFTMILSGLAKGEAAIAALTTGFAIESLMFAPAFGISAAVGALVGQSLGARDPARAGKIGWLGGLAAFLIAAIVATPVYILVPDFISTLVGAKPDVQSEAISIVRYLCVTEPLFCLAMVLNGGLQGAGETKSPLWISLWALWGVRIPLAAVLALPTTAPIFAGIGLPYGYAMGAEGAWIAMSATQALQGILCAFSWQSGKWSQAKV